jgi:NAD(P)-dependent dehydrogenase (short-subunit alcohol dehydrogenase family)
MELRAGDVAVVTGAASGIGFALAERFAGAGLNVVAADVDESALDDAAGRLRTHGTEVLGVRTDVSKEDEVDALAAATIEAFGGVQVVCNNAGVTSRSDPWLGPISAWQWVLGVNLFGVIHGVRAFLPHLVAGGRGHIVNTASMAGLFPGLSATYDTSKHAVVALTEDLYLEMATAGIPVGVSVLCPGWVNTSIIDADRNWPEEYGELPERPVTTGVIEHHIRRATAEGMTPAAVADLVATSVEQNRFWVLPHPDWMPIATRRWDSIAEEVNPMRPEHIPGMPPTDQLLTEAFQAMIDAANEA